MAVRAHDFKSIRINIRKIKGHKSTLFGECNERSDARACGVSTQPSYIDLGFNFTSHVNFLYQQLKFVDTI